MSRPNAPASLKARGRKFWRVTIARCDLSDHETQLLAEACAVLDLVDVLAAAVERDGPLAIGSRNQTTTHPALVELRLQRAQLSHLLASLALPEPEDEQPERHGHWTTPSETGRAAARRRWNGNG
jgi:hypothetical protein